MKYLYTTKHEEGCTKFGAVYGRPVHSYEEAKLKKAGWRANPDELRQDEVKQEAPQDETEEEVKALYEELFGEKPHHKMKLDTIRTKIEEKLND